MTTDRRLDETISRWLEGEAPTQLPDRVLRAAFERTRRTRQQVGWLSLLGRLNVNRFVYALGGIAVVVVIAALALGVYVNNPSPGVGGPGSTPTTAPAASPTAEGAAPTAPATTPKPSVAQATATPRALGLPEGTFEFDDNQTAMTVTIPASGWTFDPQFSVLMKGREVANLPEAAILFWSFPAGTEFYVPGDPCRSESTAPDNPATTVDDFAAALAAQASRDASELVDVTVGGHAGKSITLHVPADAVADECEQGEFVSYGTGTDPLTRYHQGPGQIDELWILDVDGAFVILDAMYRPDTPPELVEELRSIAQSTQFDTP